MNIYRPLQGTVFERAENSALKYNHRQICISNFKFVFSMNIAWRIDGEYKVMSGLSALIARQGGTVD